MTIYDAINKIRSFRSTQKIASKEKDDRKFLIDDPKFMDEITRICSNLSLHMLSGTFIP